MIKLGEKFLADESAATAIEYALIAALIGIGIIGGLNAFGNSTNGTWGNVSKSVGNALNN